MVTTIIIIVLIIGAVLFMGFAKDLVKDKQELRERPLEQRYQILIANVNNGILDGKGWLTTFDDDPRLVNMMDPNRRNIKIQFYYSTGTITIILLYLYLHKELKFEKKFYGMRNASSFEQRNAANEFVEEALPKMEAHQRAVSGFGNSIPKPASPIRSSSQPSSSDDDPEAFIQDALTDGMTERQKMSAVNFVYLVCKASGASDKEIFNEIVFSQNARSMGVDVNKCLAQLRTSGESGVTSDLLPLNASGQMDMILFTAFCSVPINGVPNENRIAKLLSLAEQLGLSEEDVANRIQKIQLMGQMFGMG